MKLIIIEDSVYKVTEKQYQTIRKKETKILKGDYYPGQDLDFNEFLIELKPQLKKLGFVSFHFQL